MYPNRMKHDWLVESDHPLIQERNLIGERLYQANLDLAAAERLSPLSRELCEAHLARHAIMEELLKNNQLIEEQT